MLTLYQRTDCPFCWKVRLALRELSVAHEIIETRLGEKHPDVMRHSPTQTVPVLVDGDVVIWDSSIMLDYLDAQYAPGRLIPLEPAQQARVRTLHAYSDKCVGPAIRDLVFEKRSKLEPEWDLGVIQGSELKWRACQAYLEGQLTSAGFFGVEYGAADCALAARCGVAEAYGADVSTEYPHLHGWFGQVKLRPSWSAAYPENFISKQKPTI